MLLVHVPLGMMYQMRVPSASYVYQTPKIIRVACCTRLRPQPDSFGFHQRSVKSYAGAIAVPRYGASCGYAWSKREKLSVPVVLVHSAVPPQRPPRRKYCPFELVQRPPPLLPASVVPEFHSTSMNELLPPATPVAPKPTIDPRETFFRSPCGWWML